MKPTTSKLTALLLAFSFVFAFCSKEPITERPAPGGGGKPAPVTELVRFAAQINLNGQPYHSSSLQAVVTVVNEQGAAVLTDKQLTITIGEVVTTEAVTLPVGGYRLTSFRLVHGGVRTRFAAPLAQSEKAAQVSKPLAIAFQLRQATPLQVPVAVLPVAEDDRPAAFGYPTGAFDNNQSEQSPHARIKVRTEIKVGEVLYEFAQSSLSLTSYNAAGDRSTRYLSLKPGINEIDLEKTASRYTMRATVWGASADLELNRSELGRDTVYTFKLAATPKKLKGEVSSRLVNGRYVAEERKDYDYDASGKLVSIRYAFRQPDGTIIRGTKEQISYRDGLVSGVVRTNEKGAEVFATSFEYGADKRVVRMTHREGIFTTTAAVSYLGNPATSIGISYTIAQPGYSYTKRYHQGFHNGNVNADGYNADNHDFFEGRYDHDQQLNPYFFLNLPNITMSHLNRNNITRQYLTYENTKPDEAPYRFDYTYNADGFPKDVIRYYRSFDGNGSMPVKTMKTVFEYQ